MQEPKYSNSLPFRILIGVSPVVALFEGCPSITSFVLYALTGWNKNFTRLLTIWLILIKNHSHLTTLIK